MARRGWIVVPASVLFGFVATLGAMPPAQALDDAAIVARIGETSVAASVIKRALAGVPVFELYALGGSRADILKKYVDEAIVREELLAQAGKARGALADHAVALQIEKALAGAVVRKELEALGGREGIDPADVKAYYDTHVGEYRTPERARVWHIVVATQAEADATLAKAKADPTREGWPKLCSEVSLDPNTKKSSGDLGFVSADGRTGEPKVRVPKEIVTAAFLLKDGEIAAAPVKSEAGFHIVWRRGSVPAMTRSLADETPTIRELLFEKKRESTYKALVERLRTAAKAEVDESLLPLVAIQVGSRNNSVRDPSLKPRSEVSK